MRVVLGVTSSAAAYKGVELASLLRHAGLEVDAVPSPAACRLVSPAQLACVTGRPVHVDLFPGQPSDPIPHITLSEGAALAVVAPATAHCLARLAAGLADDLLTTTLLACDCPLVLAPAMNPRMWAHPATRQNVSILDARGAVFVGPVRGMLACGAEGEGRMAEPEAVAAVCLSLLERSRP
jgi:phosphopantothenoylcysteine decarboxylase/phosphopantothenate--cysteine ligase